jgi:hypothetical protein
MTILSEKEFQDRFVPQTHPDGNLFDWDQIKHLDYRNVWSIVENDENNNWYALPGFHIVNVLGYVTSALPWTDDIDEAMYFEDDFDHEDEEE